MQRSVQREVKVSFLLQTVVGTMCQAVDGQD